MTTLTFKQSQDRASIILAYLRTHGVSQSATIAAGTGLTVRAVARSMTALRRMGLVVIVPAPGTRPSCRKYAWRLSKAGDALPSAREEHDPFLSPEDWWWLTNLRHEVAERQQQRAQIRRWA